MAGLAKALGSSFWDQFQPHPNQAQFTVAPGAQLAPGMPFPGAGANQSAVTPPTMAQQQTNNPNPMAPPTSVQMGGLIGAGINKALQPLPAYGDLYGTLSGLGQKGGYFGGLIQKSLGTGVDDPNSRLAQAYAKRQGQQQALQMVLMRNPQTGQVHQIPSDQVAAALQAGGVRA